MHYSWFRFIYLITKQFFLKTQIVAFKIYLTQNRMGISLNGYDISEYFHYARPLIITRETTKLRQQLGHSHGIMGKECSPPWLSRDWISTGDSSQTFSPDVTVQKPTLRLKETLTAVTSHCRLCCRQLTTMTDFSILLWAEEQTTH